jgi:hypothetical protein
MQRRVFLSAAVSIGLMSTAACDMLLHRDLDLLNAFKAAYEQFDRQASAFSVAATEANERAAERALADLSTRASMQVSSLMKNDGSMMRAAREVSADATMELAALRDHHKGKFEEARRARTDAYAHFERLLSAPPNSE